MPTWNVSACAVNVMAKKRAACIMLSPYAAARRTMLRASQRKLFSPVHSASCRCSSVRTVLSRGPSAVVSLKSWVLVVGGGGGGGGGKYDGTSSSVSVSGGTNTIL